MLILGIETSCDETAAAVVADGRTILSEVTLSQDLHNLYGGVVPELASREHTRTLVPVVREAISEAEISYDDLEGIAVTNGPGLVGALLVGLATWGIAILKKKVNLEAGKVALDQVDQIVGTVVGNLTQTTVKKLRAATKNGRLTKEKQYELRNFAISQAKELISTEVSKAASGAVDNLTNYINQKVEEKVLAAKKG